MRSALLLLAAWLCSRAAFAQSQPQSHVVKADYPSVYAYSAFVGTLPSKHLPQVTYHNDARVLGGMELSRRVKVGFIAMWMQTQMRLSRDETSGWYRGVTAGPIVAYTRRHWCFHAIAAFGFSGQEWNDASRRILPVLLACWAPSERLLFRVGATAAWGPDRLRPIPLLAWAYRAGRFDTRGMLPLHARASYWVTSDVALGVGGAGFLMPYSTNTTSHGAQVGVVYTVFGAQVNYRTKIGIGVRLTMGAAMTPLMLDAQGNDFANPAVSPASMLFFYVDEGIRH